MLFDAGELYNLTARELHRIDHVFVTHTHIDHFIGFDRLIRVLLGRERPLFVYGPRGIIKSVKGKLSGYTWNLIKEYPLSILVFEVSEGRLQCSRFSAKEGFREVEMETTLKPPLIYENHLFQVLAMEFDHEIPVLGYCVQEREHLNVDTSVLKRLGLKVGPWLSILKDNIRRGRLQERIAIEGTQRVVTAEEMLKEAAVRKTRGQRFSYIMDVTPSEENIKRLIEFVRGSDALFIEAYFLHEDLDRALKRRHLTARMAGRVARQAGVRQVTVLHVSPKYRSREDEVLRELKEYAEGIRH